jgi:cytoskeletal protein CcmA (bactofilin family)
MFAAKSARKAGRTRKIGKGATLISENTVIHGDLEFKDQLFVNGRIEGNVSAAPDSTATLIISDVGSVQGEIRVPFVIINGAVDGDVFAHQRVELAANAAISGNVYYQLIEMQLGARVDGQLVHVEEAAGDAQNVHPLPVHHGDGPRTREAIAAER